MKIQIIKNRKFLVFLVFLLAFAFSATFVMADDDDDYRKEVRVTNQADNDNNEIGDTEENYNDDEKDQNDNEEEEEMNGRDKDDDSNDDGYNDDDGDYDNDSNDDEKDQNDDEGVDSDSDNESDNSKDEEKEQEERKEKNNNDAGEEHRSRVANVVQELIRIADRDGGIGEEVRVVAQEEREVGEKVKEGVEAVEERGGFKTFFVGSDYKNLGALRSEMVTTSNHLDILNNALGEAEDESVKADLEAQIAELANIKAEVETFIEEMEGKFSLFGWLVKAFQ